MTRQHVPFSCLAESLVGTLDDAEGSAGLLVVSGGNAARNGAFSGLSRLSAQVAAAGFPVFRFDRRGVGDSSGENLGFRASAPDVEAAIARFRQQCPQVRRFVGFGNCDGAAALMLGRGFGMDALVLANPWTFDDEASDETTPEAIRARSLEKLRNPREIARLITGKVSLGGVARSLKRAATTRPSTTILGETMASSLAEFDGDVRILLASRDRTAQAFKANFPISDQTVHECTGADHAFSDPEHSDWLRHHIIEVLNDQA
ncbi:hydrolase 1, exosortase A system-associated [Aurantiacibacter odishensis]|uniref:hydrolase 1, exosortase A system-associated n=1 Tax=Aurantiacibacter odishensis TaxID=1155476 RepID=UPI000E752D68|nr:hydrolase 1, exosortase A system-associated [Aurantiacibacter odishensis]